MYLWISIGDYTEYRICSDIDILRRYIRYRYSFANIIFEKGEGGKIIVRGDIVTKENEYSYTQGYIINIKEIENFIIDR